MRTLRCTPLGSVLYVGLFVFICYSWYTDVDPDLVTIKCPVHRLGFMLVRTVELRTTVLLFDGLVQAAQVA